jgi:hypothetical protein
MLYCSLKKKRKINNKRLYMSLLKQIFAIPPILKTRRHHALEHATLQVLSRNYPQIPTMGYSDAGGFWVVGNLATEAVRDAVDEALSRLQKGETQLAVHPNCGTNYVVAGTLAGSLAWLVMASSQGNMRRRFQDWPLVVMVSIFGFILGLPLGIKFQRQVTIDPQPGNMKVIEIRIFKVLGVPVHRIHTHYAA